MKKKIGLILVLALCLSLLAACGEKNTKKEEPLTIVGTWQYDGELDCAYIFNANGRGVYRYCGVDMPFSYTDNGTKLSILYDGNTFASEPAYSISGKILSIEDSFGELVTYKWVAGEDPSVPDAPTETPTETSTVPPTEISTVPTEVEPVSDIDPIGLVGTWQRTHAEIEGDKNKNTKATLTISGGDASSLTLTFKDKESSNFNAKEKALETVAGELYSGCGNDIWYAEASSGSNTYSLTLLDDNTLLLQLTFDFDGHPMVSTQWFARSE